MMETALSLAVVLWIINAIDARDKLLWHTTYVVLAVVTLAQLVAESRS